MLSRVAPWLASRSETAADGISVRVLGAADTRALRVLAMEDPCSERLHSGAPRCRRGAPHPLPVAPSVFGVFDGDALVGACWAGANLVPVQLDPGLASRVAAVAHRAGRRYASIFGPAETVLALHSRLEQLGHFAHEVRADQPLLAISGPPASTQSRLGFGQHRRLRPDPSRLCSHVRRGSGLFALSRERGLRQPHGWPD